MQFPLEENEDPSRDILRNLDDIAFTNLDQERNTRWISKEGKQAVKVMQAAM